MKQVRNVNLASDQLKRHSDIIEAETKLLEKKIAKKNEEKQFQQRLETEQNNSFRAREGPLVPMFKNNEVGQENLGLQKKN